MSNVTTTAVNGKVIKDIEKQTLSLLDQAKAFFITAPLKWTVATYTQVAEQLKPCKELRKVIVADFKDPKGKAREAWQAICDLENKKLAEIDAVIKLLQDGMNVYVTEQNRLKKIEEDRLRKEAEEKAEKERKALEKKAEKAEAKGNGEKAEELREMAQDVYAKPIETVDAGTAVKTEGVTAFTQTDLEITVDNLEAFLKALLAGGYKPTMVEVKPGALKTWAKALELNTFPGLTIRKVTKARVR